jgi:hypothetical protein
VAPVRGARTLAGAHACYLIVTGLWPVVHRASFERVTGPKRDFWLVRVVGGLVAASGVALALPVVRGRRSPEAQTLAAGSGVVLAVADVWAGRNESKMYFADLPLQVLFTPAWFIPWRASQA